MSPNLNRYPLVRSIGVLSCSGYPGCLRGSQSVAQQPAEAQAHRSNPPVTRGLAATGRPTAITRATATHQTRGKTSVECTLEATVASGPITDSTRARGRGYRW